MNRWEQAEAERRAREEKRAADRAKRREELNFFSQIEVQRAAQRQAAEAEHEAFASRVQAGRAAAERGEIDPESARRSVPTIDSIFEAKLAQELAAQEEAERQRIAALTPRDLWKSTLTFADRRRVETWEKFKKQPWLGFTE